MLGPLLWGILVWDQARYRYALFLPMSLLAIGIWLLRRVPYKHDYADSKS